MPDKDHAESLKLWVEVQKNDNRKAFDQLFYRYSDILYNYGMYLTNRPEEVKDSIQEVFIHIWVKRKKINIKASFKHYLLISYRRHLFKSKDKFKTILLDSRHDEVDELQNPEEVLIQKEIKRKTAKQLNESLARLSIREREVFVLRLIEEEKSEAVASIMEIDVNSVYKLLSKSVAKVKKTLLGA